MQTQELDELSLNTPPTKPKRNFWGQYKAYIEGLRDKGKIGREALLELASLVLAFLFARTTIVFGAMPLGIALLCAKKKRIVATGVGVALGMATLGMTGWVYGFVCLFAITLRLALSFPGKNRKILPDCETFFGELPELRIATAAVCGLVAGGYQLLAGGVSTASLLFLLSMALLCPVACGAFLATFEYAPTPEALLGKEALPKMKKRHEVLWRLGMMVLAAATCFSLKGIDLFGISLSLCLAMATGLLFSKRIDALHGMLAGGICGAVVLPLYAPAFALPGLICGVLWPVGGFFALGLGIASGAVWSAFVGELSGFLSVFPELCVTATLMWPLLQRIGKETTLPATSQSPGLSSEAIRQASESHIDQSDMHMLKLSGALASLSKVYEAYVESVETSKEELCLSACMEACEKRCTSCEHHATCWQGEMPVGEHFVAQVADSLCVGEDIDHTAMPPKMKMCCPLPEALMEDMKQAVGQVFRDAHEKERVYPALEYDIAAAMLKDVVKRERSRKKEDSRLSLEAKKILRGFGIHAKQVLVLGQKEKRVLVKGMNKTPHEGLLPKIKRELETLCGCPFSFPHVDVEGDTIYMELIAMKRYQAETAVVMRSALPGDISGDTVRFFDVDDYAFFALLSDGMGTGKEAAAVSGLCTSFLQKLLEAGCHRTTAVKLLNQTVRTGCRGSGATLDLVEIDQIYGEACFLKAGAAASYIKRGTQLFRVRSKTIPLGLLKDPDTEKVRFRLEAGDVIILLSDGISQMPEDNPTISAALSCDWGDKSLSEVASGILSASSAEGERADDMTVALIKIAKAT